MKKIYLTNKIKKRKIRKNFIIQFNYIDCLKYHWIKYFFIKEKILLNVKTLSNLFLMELFSSFSLNMWIIAFYKNKNISGIVRKTQNKYH